MSTVCSRDKQTVLNDHSMLKKPPNMPAKSMLALALVVVVSDANSIHSPLSDAQVAQTA